MAEDVVLPLAVQRGTRNHRESRDVHDILDVVCYHAHDADSLNDAVCLRLSFAPALDDLPGCHCRKLRRRISIVPCKPPCVSPVLQRIGVETLLGIQRFCQLLQELCPHLLEGTRADVFLVLDIPKLGDDYPDHFQIAVGKLALFCVLDDRVCHVEQREETLPGLFLIAVNERVAEDSTED